jgi:hypothetical protein
MTATCDWPSGVNNLTCPNPAAAHAGGWHHCRGHLALHYEQHPQDRPAAPIVHGRRPAIDRHRQLGQPLCVTCRQAEKQRNAGRGKKAA